MIVLYAGWNPTSQAYEAKPLGSDWQQRTHSMQRGPRPPTQHVKVSSKSFFYQKFPSSAKQENLDVSVLPSCSLTSSCVVHKDVKSAKCLHNLVHGCCYSDMFWKKYEVKYFMDYIRGQNKTKSNSRRPNKSQARHVVENQQHEDCKSWTSVGKTFNLKRQPYQRLPCVQHSCKGQGATQESEKSMFQHKQDWWLMARQIFPIIPPDWHFLPWQYTGL